MTALDAADAALVELSAALAAGRRAELEAALEEADAVLPPGEVEEAILQAYLFVGFPAALEAMAVWRSLRGGDPAPEPDPLAGAENATAWRERGERRCRKVYGTAYEELRRNVRRLHPALDRWMIEEGYGKVLGRPGLDPVRRELCNIALLAVTAHERQLHSHLRGALNLGTGPDAVAEALERALRRARDPAWVETARRRWHEVRERAGPAGSRSVEGPGG